MKLSGLSLLCLLVFVAGAHAQDATDDPKGGTLVDCGAEKVAVFAHTESPDGRYALGWTIRPNRKRDPVDWSVYKSDDRGSFYEKYAFVGNNDYDMDKQDYRVVDGILDLNAKRFTPLLSDNPYFPGKNHWDIFVGWSEDRHGTRYVVVSNQARFYTHNLWLATLKGGSSQEVNLLPQADKAVKNYMRKRDPKDHARYSASYEPANVRSGTNAKPTVFTRASVTVYFEAAIPKDEVNSDEGYITFSLPAGKVMRVTKRSSN